MKEKDTKAWREVSRMQREAAKETKGELVASCRLHEKTIVALIEENKCLRLKLSQAEKHLANLGATKED